ncbi:hypothetical protein B0H15DRAFT_214695 [Mycena belliarum]|uniref:Uncharacterized protein n=1 Tax=Mycena belliarum TaxID=1033014 RepID=A0AAD6UM76_9AGAR|nr:hypothetical protein B0H15DRAFT_214695 [Mycena belliae]
MEPAHTTSYPQKMLPSPESPGLHRACNTGHEKCHPYNRANPGTRQKDRSPRRIWTHALEKPLFTILELTTLGQTQRRPIYIASLEAHIDSLHVQLSGLGPDFHPVNENELLSLKGLNAKTCKAMVAGLQNDIAQAHERLLELQRSNEELEAALRAAQC